MAAYYLAPSLSRCRSEVNARWPGRDKTSDGWVGDTSHAARASDHNPDWGSGGVVRAIDVDRDGIDPMALVAAAIAHPATSFVIFSGSIWSRLFGFRRRTYTGTNRHDHHVHVSIQHGTTYQTSTRQWLTATQEDDMFNDADRGGLVALTKVLGEVAQAVVGFGRRTEQTQAAVERVESAQVDQGNRLAKIERAVAALPSAILNDEVVEVTNPVTDQSEEVNMRSAIGRAASSVSNAQTRAQAKTARG